MKTTIEIPDELFRKAKATAALQGESLKDLICAAIETRLASMPRPQSERSGWRSVFGLAEAKTVARVQHLIDSELEHIEPAEWR